MINRLRQSRAFTPSAYLATWRVVCKPEIAFGIQVQVWIKLDLLAPLKTIQFVQSAKGYTMDRDTNVVLIQSLKSRTIFTYFEAGVAFMQLID